MRLLQSAFQGRRLARYREVMAAETERWLDGLGDRGSFDVWDELEPLTMWIAASTLLGPEVRARIEEFRPLLGDLARGMEFVLPPNLPLPKFRRRDRARRLLTGYITTAAQMSWALVLLLGHPGYPATVVDELGRTGYARSQRLDRALKEAIRLRPVMSHYARTTAEDYDIDGFRVPKGWLTMLCPAVAHRLPEVFTDPERYDPERFGPGRQEDRRHPHAMIGFSGGFYRCPGSAFGTHEMQTVLGRFLERYEAVLETPSRNGSGPPADFDMGVIRPAAPCRIHYARRA